MTLKGGKHSEETKRKIGDAIRGRKHSEETLRKMREKVVPEETRRKIALANIGRKDSPERRKKISDALKGRKLSEEHIRKIGLASTGRKHSEETKRKMSQLQLGKKLSEEHKRKLSESKKKLFASGYVNPNKGKKFPEEFRQKCRVRMTGHSPSAATREKNRIHRSTQVFPAKDTDIEIKLRRLLEDAEIKFETQRMYIKRGLKIRGQPDILIKPNICIFADGDYWHANPNPWMHVQKLKAGAKADDSNLTGGVTAKSKWASDKKVTDMLKKSGYVVLRFWGDEIHEYGLTYTPGKIIKIIKKTIKEARK